MDKYEKAAKQHKGLYLTITYDLTRLTLNGNIDTMFEKLAKKYGGEEFGSGGGFGGRDLNFGFLEVKKANQFVVAAKKLAKKIHLRLNHNKKYDMTLFDYFGFGDEKEN